MSLLPNTVSITARVSRCESESKVNDNARIPFLHGRTDNDLNPLQLTILVVVDWPDSAQALGIALGFYGHIIHIAKDGDEAIETIKNLNPNVVLLDLVMPGISGLDTMARILSEKSRKPLLIAISGYCTKEDKAAAFKAGLDHFFVKPVELDNLRRIFEQKENCHFVLRRDLDNSAQNHATPSDHSRTEQEQATNDWQVFAGGLLRTIKTGPGIPGRMITLVPKDDGQFELWVDSNRVCNVVSTGEADAWLRSRFRSRVIE